MKRILCVGECMLELTSAGDRTLRLGFAGDTYNTAVYLRRTADNFGLDAEVGYLTGLGDDAYSDAMRDAWRAELIVDRSLRLAGRLPGLYAVSTTEDGERSFNYWRGESAARELFAGTHWITALSGDLVHLSGITLQLTSPPSREALVARLRELRRAGTQVSFDTNYRPAGWPSANAAVTAIAAICAECDIVLASQDDEEMLHGAARPEEHVRRLAATTGAEVILRNGSDGAYVNAGDAVIHAPAATVDNVVDTTAAGDAFAGAYLAARLDGAVPSRAAAVGNAVAAHVIQIPGAIAPLTHQGAP
jgi:2-dehydro-3-deoxygluconokinase